MNKRSFLKTTLLSASAFAALPMLSKSMKAFEHIPSEELAKNDDFWQTIYSKYKIKTEYINLESGYYNIMPQEVLEKYINHLREINLLGAFYMRTVQAENKAKVTARLADLVGCSKEELIITRNTTESLDMIIAGQNWQTGDEAIIAVQDYGAMRDMFKQISDRYGIKLIEVSIPLHPQSDNEIIELYAKAISPKTKLMMLCHIINITGQILPVKKICDMAHNRGVQVMVDGAHAIAHLEFKIDDLNCDYYGASLHKWLCAPLGAGMLYIKKEHIPNIWPLLAEAPIDKENVLRLNHTGTIPVHTDLAILDAINFYEIIGAKRKEDRLRYLQEYWTKQVRSTPKIILNTPEDSNRACAIANVGIEGLSPADLAIALFEKYKIYTVAIDGAEVHGCRITPNVFTRLEELDVLVMALKELAA